MILGLFIAAVMALGASGGIRASSAKNRFEAAVRRYNEIRADLGEARTRLTRALQSIGEHTVGAIKSLSKVGDGHRSWTFELRTKQDLLRDCLPAS